MSKRIIIIIIVVLVILITTTGFIIYRKTLPDTPGTENVLNDTPFGNPSGNAINPQGTINTSSVQNFGSSTDQSNLIKLSDAPTAGGVIYINNNIPTARIIERATGFVFANN
jgi:hypothetical protein